MRYASFAELYSAVGALRGRGDTAAAIALLTAHLDDFGRQTALLHGSSTYYSDSATTMGWSGVQPFSWYDTSNLIYIFGAYGYA